MFCPRCGEQVDTSNRYCPRCGQDLTQLTGSGRAGATMPMTAAAPQPPQESEDAAVAEALKDEYELEKELGRGGMAVVYKAKDKQLEREVAIKVLPFSLSFDAEFVERFQREARTAGKLEHPNIIPIYRVGKSGRVIYFVMKYIRGKSLSAVIESRGALPVAEIKRFLIECTRALGYAHKHGIVHRDIKPDNIMFDDLGQAIVTDFGIAKAQSGARLTGTGMSIGTPHYMSPEQARAQNLDGRSDIYSLGVVAYQALTGHVPFDGEDSFSIGYKHIMEELPVPQLDTADQRDLFGVVQRMMAKKPDDRFQNADELVGALETGAGPSPMDLATMPTRAIEPFKPPTAAPGAAPRATPMTPMAAQPTTPLPRASASMGKPKLTEEEAAAPAAPAPAPPAKRRPFKPKAADGSSKGGIGGVIAALAIVGSVIGAGYYYFGVYKPQHERALAQRDSLARAESVATLARADSLRRDSVQRADSIAQAAAHARATPPPTTTTPPPSTASRPAPSTATAAAARPGTLRLGGQIPTGARVTINGEQRTGTTFQLPAGRYQIAIEAQGYRPYSNTATVQPGRTASIKVTLTREGGLPTASGTTPPPSTATTTTASVNCAAPTVYQQNPGRACWDSRPVPNTRPQLQAPASCSGRVTPANILVNVSVSGEAVSANISRASSCQEFTQRALAYVQDMTFRPSMKSGAAVPGWVIVPVTPTP